MLAQRQPRTALSSSLRPSTMLLVSGHLGFQIELNDTDHRMYWRLYLTSSKSPSSAYNIMHQPPSAFVDKKRASPPAGSYGRLNYKREFFDSRDPGPCLTRRSSGAHRKTPFPVTYKARLRNAPFLPPSSQLVSFNVLYISTDNHFPAGRGNLSPFLVQTSATSTLFHSRQQLCSPIWSLFSPLTAHCRQVFFLHLHPWYSFKLSRSFTIVLNFSPIRILSHPMFNMRCIPFLLLGLISATYAIPTPLPPAGSQRLQHRYPSGPLFQLQSTNRLVEYEHWGPDDEIDIESWMDSDDAPLYQDAQHWAAEFIEQRLFREALGVRAGLNGHQFLLSHPRRLKFRIRTQDLYVIAVRGFVMSQSPADISAHHDLAVKRSLLFKRKTGNEECIVEVDFGDNFAVAHFKPSDPDSNHNPYWDPKIIIPLNDRDRELFKKCDDLVSGRSQSTTPDHDPHSHNSPVTPTHSSPPQGHDDFPPHDDRNPPSTPPSHNNPPARHAYPNQSPPPPYEP
ncbi:hypothetical protein C8R42DRAFT_692139 [Lentinula raphanica]|nr:hypothetical protein C8R42DRAFT_692139 [Lentinula raphanica]